MESFAEQMKATADAILKCRKDRGNFLGQVKDATEDCLESARGAVHQMAQDFRTMARETRGSLQANKQARAEYMDRFRRETRKNRDMAHAALCDMLATTRKCREDHVGNLMDSFFDCRESLKKDFQKASRYWKRVFGG